MRSLILIPVMLLTLIATPTTQAEDLFEIEIGTKFKKILMMYPDLKVDEKVKLEGGQTQYTSRSRDSIFHRIAFLFDSNKRLLRFHGEIISANEIEHKKACENAHVNLRRRCGYPHNEGDGFMVFEDEGLLYLIRCFDTILITEVAVGKK